MEEILSISDLPLLRGNFYHPFMRDGDEDGQEERHETPFSDGRFQRFCEIRGGNEKGTKAIVGQLDARNVKRWSEGSNMPAAKTWVKLAAAFGFADPRQVVLAYADFLRAQDDTTPFSDALGQPTLESYRVGVERSLKDVAHEARAHLERIADFDILGITPRSRRENLESSRAKILQILALLELEYRDFSRQFEK
jgi:hypothetical protein